MGTKPCALLVSLMLVACALEIIAQPIESKHSQLCNTTEQQQIEEMLKNGLVASDECTELWKDVTSKYTSPVDQWDQISMNDTLFLLVCSNPTCKNVLSPWTDLPNCEGIIDMTTQEIANLYEMAMNVPGLCDAIVNVKDTGDNSNDQAQSSPNDANDSVTPKVTAFRSVTPSTIMPSTLAPISRRPFTSRPTASPPLSSSISNARHILSSIALLCSWGIVQFV